MYKDYDYAPNTTIKFTFATTNKIAVQSKENLTDPIDIKLPAPEPTAKRFGKWVVEIVGCTLFLREGKGSAARSALIISTQDSEVNVSVSYMLPNGSQKIDKLKTARIDVYPREVGKFRVTMSANEESERYQKLLEAEKKKNKELSDKLTSANALISSLEEKLRKFTDVLGGDIGARERSIETVIQTLETASQQAAGRLKALEEERDKKQKELRDRQEEIAAAEKDIEAAERENGALIARKAEIEKQMTDLASRRDFYELDCKEAQERLDGLRAQLELDGDTLALIEDDSFLKRRSVSSALDEIESEIKSVEKRIALIIRFQEKFSAKANQASDSSLSDGMMDLADEILRNTDSSGDPSGDSSGGDDNGDGSSAPGADEQAAE